MVGVTVTVVGGTVATVVPGVKVTVVVIPPHVTTPVVLHGITMVVWVCGTLVVHGFGFPQLPHLPGL